MSAFHSVRNSYLIEGLQDCCADRTIRNVSQIVSEKLGDKLYTINFIAGSGQFGVDYWNLEYKKSKAYLSIKKPVKGSIESFLNAQPWEYCFVDFENESISKTSFYMKSIFNRYLKSQWSHNFSAIFFIKKMKPLLLNRYY